MRGTVFRGLCDVAYQQAGIRLGDEKLALVTARVGKRLRALNLADEAEYLELLRRDDSGSELTAFLDVISTNFTSFYREPDHFTRLEALLAAAVKAGQQTFRIWCAASSSGEEPYTLAIVLAEVLGSRDWKILATDISTRVLTQARAGVYRPEHVKPVPRELLARYFEAGRGDDGEPRYAVTASLKQRVTFARLNLSQPPFPMRGPFDAIFCRNVMIYFDQPVRQALVSEMQRLVRPGGLVIVGHSETLSGLSTTLDVVAPSVYRHGGRS